MYASHTLKNAGPESRALGVRPEAVLGWALPGNLVEGEPLRQLAAKLAQSPIRKERVAQWIAYRTDGYSRLTLFLSRQWEMVLTCWLPNQSSAIHNHGGSCGVSLVIEGQLTETLFQGCAEADSEGQVRPSCVRTVGSGAVLIETCKTVHRVANLSNQIAIGLHLYSPPIARMEPFDCAGLRP